MTKFALLVPTTSRGRRWRLTRETDLVTKLIASLHRTRSPGIEYRLYVGVDHDDPLFTQTVVKQELVQAAQRFKFTLEVISMQIAKGHLTKMWNLLFDKAYKDGCEYFFQCGDDVVLQGAGWTDSAIKALTNSKGIGVTSPLDERWRKQGFFTQSIVSRKHMEIFGYYFPQEITNWHCDNWINRLYARDYKFPLPQTLSNKGGKERYQIVRAEKLCADLVARDKAKLAAFIQSQKVDKVELDKAKLESQNGDKELESENVDKVELKAENVES